MLLIENTDNVRTSPSPSYNNYYLENGSFLNNLDSLFHISSTVKFLFVFFGAGRDLMVLFLKSVL